MTKHPKRQKTKQEAADHLRAIFGLLAPLLAFAVLLVCLEIRSALHVADIGRGLPMDGVGIYLAISVVLLGCVSACRLIFFGKIPLWMKAVAFCLLLINAASVHILVDALSRHR